MAREGRKTMINNILFGACLIFCGIIATAAFIVLLSKMILIMIETGYDLIKGDSDGTETKI